MTVLDEIDKRLRAERARFAALDAARPPKPAAPSPRVGPPTFDAATLKMAIRFRHQSQSAVLIEELLTTSGPKGGRYIDVWAIRPNPEKGCMATSYEIKVSRSDFLRDLKDPLKQRAARLISDQFFFVAPPGVLQASEIPDWAGLLEPDGRYGAADPWRRWQEDDLPLLHEVVPAPYRSKDSPSWGLLVSMLRREAIIIPADAEKA